jgi:NADPH:quinone reductase-like Zn-dependent oxidoreductase
MLCQIYATVGTEEKRQFVKNMGVPDDHIFSSRSADFAIEIMRQTGGYGVDVIMNSLSGELLEASWNLVAFGGTMLEIGKKDIYDHCRLSMEPFKRNASFRVLDLSPFKKNLKVIERYDIPLSPFEYHGQPGADSIPSASFAKCSISSEMAM